MSPFPLAPLQCNHRNLARCIPLVLAVLWVHLRPASVDAVALLTGHRGSDGVIGLVPHLDGEFRVGKQIVVPVGIGWRPPFGGEDEQAVVFAQVHQRAGEAPTALGACGREQKQRPAFPYAADLSSIRPERLNRLAIPIISVRHIFSFMKKLMPTRSAFLLRARLVLCHSITSQQMTSSNLHMYPYANLHKSNGPFSPRSGSRMVRLSTSALPAQGSVSCTSILTDSQGSCLIVDGHWRSWPDILATSLVCYKYRRRLSRSHPLSGGISLPLLLPAVPQRSRAPLPPAVSRACAR